jgi:ATP-dependent helicase/nuclease subunit B
MAETGLFFRRNRGDPLVYSIPAHRSFSDALASGLIAAIGRNPLALASGRILLPNNRAVRTVTEAFVRASGGGLVLPRLIAVGDPDLGERIGGALDPLDLAPDLPPAIDPLDRQLLLARLVRAEGEGAAEAMRLAATLAAAMDALAIEEIPASRLADAVSETPELASHWLHSIERFRGVLDRWPNILADRGVIDLAERRGRLLHSIAQRWADRPPEGFTLAAGITTSAPAIAALLARIARLDEGAVVVPALADERAMPQEEWEALGPEDDGRGAQSHPQFHLKRLLQRISVSRDEVLAWKGGGRAASSAARGRAVVNAMAMPAFSDKWMRLPPPERRLTGIRVAELSDPASEAQAIAIALREAVETPGRTAALVTPDRNLAARVSGHLLRWGIEADDSAGLPLSKSPAGTFLLAIAAAVVDELAPVALLSLLKHPLAAEGEERLSWLEAIRSLDLALRGPRPRAGIEGLDERFAEKSTEVAWRRVRGLVAKLSGARGSMGNLAGAAKQLRILAQSLAGDAAWRGPDGRAASELLDALESSADATATMVAPEDVVPLLRELMASRPVRKAYGGHPRIFIWGLLEARLQQADLMILGGPSRSPPPESPSKTSDHIPPDNKAPPPVAKPPPHTASKQSRQSCSHTNYLQKSRPTQPIFR